jgi:N4-gp56 family major capsid protein
MRFRQLCDVKEAIGTRKGNTFNWDILANVTTGGSVDGISETAAMPVDEFTITVGTCVVTEFGNSIPLTRKLKDMSEYDVKSMLRQSLVNDMAKTVDKAVFKAFSSGLLIAGPAAGTHVSSVDITSAGSATTSASGTAGLTTAHVLNLVDLMKERNIPTFDGDSYLCISHPSTLTNIRGSLISYGQYTESGRKTILSGEIGMFGGVRFIEQTNVAKVTPTNAGNGVGWALFVGGEACVEALAVPEELIEKEVTDYGRSLGLGWYGTFGYKLPFAIAANQRSIFWWPNVSSPNVMTP